MSTGLHVRVARWLRHRHNHSGRQFLSRYFYFGRFVKLPASRQESAWLIRSSFFMKCLEVEFSACEIWPSYWPWSFSWLVDGKRGRREEEKHARNQGKDPSSKKWKGRKKNFFFKLQKQNQFTNFTFSIFQLSTPHSWSWLSWLNSILWNGTKIWGEWWGAGFEWELTCFQTQPRALPAQPRVSKTGYLLFCRWVSRIPPPLVLQSQKHSCQRHVSVTSLCHLQAARGRPPPTPPAANTLK